MGGPSAIGICAFFHMSKWWSVVVLQRSMVNSLEGPSAIGIYAFFDMSKWWSVVVLQRSVVNSWGAFCHWYKCMFWYVKVMKCSGIAEIYGWFMGEASALGICAFPISTEDAGYVCISAIWYVKVMKCSGVAEIYGWFRVVSLPLVYVHSLI